ncbi:MAG: NifU family protein [Alphaproteobacteria bacterium]|nr:NifU family protein [Alphaproteobacteria bacterium]
MFIQTETTPNPATLKFLPGRAVMEGSTADFRVPPAPGVSPLAARLFAVEGVDGVFLGTDFITVTKADGRDWQVVKPIILAAIMEHYTSGEPAVVAATGDNAEAEGADSDVVAQIKELLETRVRPAVAQDGGDIVFRKYEEGIVYLRMQGSCSGCPSSAATLKVGIENMLKHFIPEIREVRPVE